MELRLTQAGTFYVLGSPLQEGTFSQVVPLVPEEGPGAFDTLEEALKARERLSENLRGPLAVYEVVIKCVVPPKVPGSDSGPPERRT